MEVSLFCRLFKVFLSVGAIFVLKDIIIKETKEYSIANKVDIIKNTVIEYQETEQKN
ncbi:MAG: hypothetical protein LBG23_04390 [Endomicrobium sp.]|nr:hypothetical protein [Endomicrobium sp.]